jgi:hypothetical protein
LPPRQQRGRIDAEPPNGSEPELALSLDKRKDPTQWPIETQNHRRAETSRLIRTPGARFIGNVGGLVVQPDARLTNAYPFDGER